MELRLSNKADKPWIKKVLTECHYLHIEPHPRSRPHYYVLEHSDERLGIVSVGLPHATVNGRWWGKDGLPTQWQVVDLSRVWLHPRIQRGGELCRPDIVPGFIDRKGRWHSAAATWFMREVLKRVQVDRISLWPPVFLEKPYHILLAISYHDPQYHSGTIYKQMGWLPMYTNDDGKPILSSTGKYGWCWRLPEPDWTWNEIEIARPRTLRLPLAF